MTRSKGLIVFGPVLRNANDRNLFVIALADPWQAIPYVTLAKSGVAVEHLVFSGLCGGHRQTGPGSKALIS